MPEPTLTDANAALIKPVLHLMRESEKDLPTKVGVLIDAAAVLLASSDRMRVPSELRLTADEMRKRLIHATRLHQDALDARATKREEALDSVLRDPLEGAARSAEVVKFPMRID